MGRPKDNITNKRGELKTFGKGMKSLKVLVPKFLRNKKLAKEVQTDSSRTNGTCTAVLEEGVPVFTITYVCRIYIYIIF